MSSVIKKGDLGAVDEVLGWDPRGDDEEYDMLEKAQEAFSRIKKELSSICHIPNSICMSQ